MSTPIIFGRSRVQLVNMSTRNYAAGWWSRSMAWWSLTQGVLRGAWEELVKDVEIPLSSGLLDHPRLLQEICNGMTLRQNLWDKLEGLLWFSIAGYTYRFSSWLKLAVFNSTTFITRLPPWKTDHLPRVPTLLSHQQDDHKSCWKSIQCLLPKANEQTQK